MESPRAVKLFPKETCSFSSARTLFHITACRLMVGLPQIFMDNLYVTEIKQKD